MKKSFLWEDGDIVHYTDKNGEELNEGDIIIYDDGCERKLYRTSTGCLGTDATNPVWIRTGRAVECEFGIYSLSWNELKVIRKKETNGV